MSNSNRGPSINASYYVSIHLTKLFQSKRFLEIDQVGNIYGISSLEIAHFVWIH
jgi:hypothetical protein